MYKKILLYLLFSVPLGLFAQPWDLKRCIDYGLKNNRNSLIYENEKKVADAKAKEALAEYLPKVNISGTFDNNLKIQQSVIPAGVFGPEPQKIAFTQKYNTNGYVQLDQKLYDQSSLISLKANKYNQQQAELNMVKSQENIIYGISNAYFQIYIYRKQLSLLSGNLATYQKQISVFKLQVEKGVTLRKDLDKVTVDYNNATSQVRIAESNLQLAQNQLKYEMGFPINDRMVVDSTTQQDVERLLQRVPEDTFHVGQLTEYRISQIDAQLLEVDQRRIGAGWLPTLAAYAKYGAVGFGSTLGPAFNDLNPYAAIGLKLSFPIFDVFKRKAQYDQARYKSLNALEKLKVDEGKYRIDYDNARTKLVKAQSNVEDDLRNIELAHSVFQITDLQYVKGVTDLADWITAQNSIKDAQNNYLTNLYSFYQARLEMEKAAGSLILFYTSL